MKVLVVEDDRKLCSFLTHALTEEGLYGMRSVAERGKMLPPRSVDTKPVTAVYLVPSTGGI